MRSLSKRLFLFFLALTLSSCAAGNESSYLTSLIPAVGREPITEFIINELAAQYEVPPKETLYFAPSGNSAFEKALEDGARAAGFQVVLEKSTEAIVVRYVIDAIQESGTSYIQLTTSDGFTLSRTFDTTSVAMNGTYLQSGRSQDE